MVQLPLRYLNIKKTIPPKGGFFSGQKLLKGLVSIVLATIFTTASVYAAFSTQSINRGNVLKTGTVILHVDSDPDTAGIQTTPIFNLSDFNAGDSITKQLFMHNGGTLPLSYNGSIVKTDGDDNLFNSFLLKIGTTNGGSELYDGTMSGFASFAGGARSLIPSSGENLYFTVSLPGDAGEAVQNKTLSVNFVFSAVQSP